MAPHRTPTADELLSDIIAWGDRLAAHVADMTRERFLADPRTQDAVARCIEVIGEAAGQLRQIAPELEQRDPAPALSKAYGARNRIAHGYAAADYGLPWMTALEAVPPMVRAARSALGNRA